LMKALQDAAASAINRVAAHPQILRHLRHRLPLSEEPVVSNAEAVTCLSLGSFSIGVYPGHGPTPASGRKDGRTGILPRVVPGMGERDKRRQASA
jgi:hypothetical protein